jgi:N-acetyl-beta-hexosaminidase
VADGAEAEASDADGLRNARTTYEQLLRLSAAEDSVPALAPAPSPALVPAITIEDWPDFPRRGCLLDISRSRVPRMETLFALVDRLASLR